MNKKYKQLELATASAADNLSQTKSKGKNNLVRVQLDLPQEKIDELNNLMKKVGLDTRKDLFNNALSMFAWAVKEKEKGHAILSMDEAANTFKELVMHPLETIATKAKNVTKNEHST